jgi:hypothetical protein
VQSASATIPVRSLSVLSCPTSPSTARAKHVGAAGARPLSIPRRSPGRRPQRRVPAPGGAPARARARGASRTSGPLHVCSRGRGILGNLYAGLVQHHGERRRGWSSRLVGRGARTLTLLFLMWGRSSCRLDRRRERWCNGSSTQEQRLVFLSVICLCWVLWRDPGPKIKCPVMMKSFIWNYRLSFRHWRKTLAVI